MLEPPYKYRKIKGRRRSLQVLREESAGSQLSRVPGALSSKRTRDGIIQLVKARPRRNTYLPASIDRTSMEPVNAPEHAGDQAQYVCPEVNETRRAHLYRVCVKSITDSREPFSLPGEQARLPWRYIGMIRVS